MSKKSKSAITSVEAFNKRLTTFTKSAKTNVNAALDCSIFAIEHFAKCGDLGPAQRFHDAMIKNYHRRGAFKMWLMAHAPVLMENGKFVKDKSKEAVSLNVEAAVKTPFWEFAPEKEDVLFSGDDFLKQLEKMLARYKGERYKATDKKAEEVLEKTDQFVKSLEHAS